MSDKIKTTDWDALLTSSPLDKTAAVVTSCGIHWEPESEIYTEGDTHSDVPLPTKHLKSFCTNLTGMKTERLLVVGSYADRERFWVVQCTCGLYEIRSTDELCYKDHDNSIHKKMCKRCSYVEEIKKNGGKWPLTSK